MANELPFIDPTAGGGKARIVPAPRPMDLAGKTVGLLDNTKEQGDLILETIAEALRERYGVAKVITRRKEHYSKPATDELINEMAKEVQVAVAAVGG
jgi:urease gamma subunit